MLRRTFLFVISLSLFFHQGALAAQEQNEQKDADSSLSEKAQEKGKDLTAQQKQKLSEAFGHLIGRNLNNPNLPFDLESVIAGIRKGASGEPAPMSDKEYEQMMTQLQERAFEKLAAENLQAAESFLSKNGQADGIVELEKAKLQYQVLREGHGDAVTEKSTPQVHYIGKFLDGTVFGNSEEMGSPITIPIGQTIPGFSKGIVGMKEGEKRRLFVHPDLAYGTKGQLPPNALLVFEIEIVKADTPSAKEDASELSQALFDEQREELEPNEELDDEYFDQEMYEEN